MRLSNDSHGVSLIAAVFIIVIFAFMGVMFVTLIGTGSFTSVNDLQSAQALYVAEGGAEYALPAFDTGTACNALAYTLAIGTAGSFTTTGTLYTPASTTLSVAIPDAISTNPVSVVSTAGFAPHGRITIGTEYIHYAAIAGNTFTGIRRGAGGSPAAAHVVGSAVSQNECLVRSVGTAGGALRTVERNITGGGGGIAFDNATSRNRNSSNDFTWSHAVSAVGANRILIVGVAIRNNSGQTVTSVTYNGVGLASLGSRNNGTVRIELWYLTGPATGTNDVRVRLSAAAGVIGGAISLTGVDQAVPIDAAAVFNSNTSAGPSVGITTVTGNAWVVDAMVSSTDGAATADASQAGRWSDATGGGAAQRIRGAGSTEGPKTLAGMVTMSWTIAAQPWAIGAVALRPAAGGSVSVIDWMDIVQ